jgi:Ca2+:H+ antiporter
LRKQTQGWLLGKLCFWLFLLSIIVPLLFLVCTICYALVFTIPMARLNWALIKHLIQHPTSIRFCSAPAIISVSAPVETEGDASVGTSAFTIKNTRLSAGQLAPSGSPTSTVLLCIYRAAGWQYYKYTIGGVNIIFINLIPVIFLVILDGMVLLPWVEARGAAGKHIPAFIAFLASRAFIFILCLASVIPLSYFIGMAVASISAQSSIGMGAVINATFGSIIEILLYSIALMEGKGRLVEGSIVGSVLAGVLLMPGMSMCGGAVRRKEQKFNAKSAGVTSMMLMMAFIGTLTPTLFYQTYGTVSSSLLFTAALFGC